MVYPQTVAKSIKNHIAEIADNGCLAMCYAYCVGLEGDALSYIELVARAIDSKVLAKDCTVESAELYLKHLTGRNFQVLKKDITDISKIKERTPVKYEYGNLGHWVVVENGKIVFNSVLNSLCVSKGRPTSARIIKMIL